MAVLLMTTILAGALTARPGAANPVLAPSPAPTGGATKYYIVGEPVTGQRESLFSIAAATLGNGNRYPEIFALNRDRIQPDGERFSDPLSVKPGWILQLPPDAEGPLVRVGAIPIFSVPTEGLHHPTAGAVPGVAAENAARASADSAPRGNSALGISALGISALLMVVLMSATVWLLVSGRWVKIPRGVRRAVRSSVGPDPTADARVLAGADVASIGSGSPFDMANRRRVGASFDLAGRHPPGSSFDVRDRRFTGSSFDASDRPPGSFFDVGGSRAPVPSYGGGERPAGSSYDEVHGPAVGAPPVVETEVRDGADILAVSLLGVQDSPGPAATTWRGEDESIGSGADSAPVALGTGPQGTLVVDVARAPDIITITGPEQAVRRQARRLAEQLAATAVSVSAIAGALGEPLPRGCRSVRGLGDPDLTEARAGGGPRVVFCPGDSPGRMGRRLAASWFTPYEPHRSPLVVVLVGGPHRAPWAIEVRPTGVAHSSRSSNRSPSSSVALPTAAAPGRMTTRHLHLVKAVACLIVAAAWAVPLVRPTLAAPNKRMADLLVQVHLLSLLTHPAGLAARDRGTDVQVRETGEKLATEHGDLERLTRAVAAQVGVELPAAATAEDQDFLHELAAARDDEFDQIFAGRLRAAHERVFPMIAAVRASTRNDAVRAFATSADAYVARHLDYLDGLDFLDGTLLVNHTTLPTAADREFLVHLSQAILWKQLAGIVAQQRAARADVRETGDLIADEARELNKAVLSAAKRLNVPLPDRPSAEQQESLTKLEAASGADFDRDFIEQLRVADGELLFAGAKIRAGTRNDVVRAFSATANSAVLRHMAYLEHSGLVRYAELPAPPRVAGLTTTGLEREDGVHPAAIWLMLAITVVVGALTGARPVDTTHWVAPRSPSREEMRHE